MSQLPPGVEPQELPEPVFFGVLRGGLLREDGFTADQMRAIEAKAAQAGYLAGLAAAADIAFKMAHSDEEACEVSAAIRALGDKQ